MTGTQPEIQAIFQILKHRAPEQSMTPADIIEDICRRFADVVPKASWGETALFYNPCQLLAYGVYFCNLKQHDGANDKASALDRAGVSRVAIGLTPASYARLFGKKPAKEKA